MEIALDLAAAAAVQPVGHCRQTTGRVVETDPARLNRQAVLHDDACGQHESIGGLGLGNGRRYALRRGRGFWELTFEDEHAFFKHEQGVLYVGWLLLHPPPAPLHALALALEARKLAGQPGSADDIIEQRSLGLDDAETIRALRRKQRSLEAVLGDAREIEPVKAEARRELDDIADYLRKNSWRSRDSAQKCVRAVSMAIQRLHIHLARARNAEGSHHPVLQAFARHLYEHLLFPSGRGRRPGGMRAAGALAGCFTYEPPPGVVWSAERGVQNAV